MHVERKQTWANGILSWNKLSLLCNRSGVGMGLSVIGDWLSLSLALGFSAIEAVLLLLLVVLRFLVLKKNTVA